MKPYRSVSHSASPPRPPPLGTHPMITTSPLVGAPLGPTLFRLAVPGVIGALLFSMPGLVEAHFLKSSGADALAAVALVYPLIILSAMFSAGAIGGAVSGLTARAVGAGDSADVGAGGAVRATLVSLRERQRHRSGRGPALRNPGVSRDHRLLAREHAVFGDARQRRHGAPGLRGGHSARVLQRVGVVDHPA